MASEVQQRKKGLTVRYRRGVNLPVEEVDVHEPLYLGVQETSFRFWLLFLYRVVPEVRRTYPNIAPDIVHGTRLIFAPFFPFFPPSYIGL